MKKSFLCLGLGLFWTTMTLAAPPEQNLTCPDLTGTFFCTKTDLRGDSLYTFSQVRQGDHWQFTMTAKLVGMQMATSYQFVTDGVERIITDAVTGRQLLSQASCKNQTLTVIGTANFDKPEKIRFSEVLSLNSDGDLEDYSGAPNGETVFEICKRQSPTL